METSVWPGLWGRSSKSEAPRVKSFQCLFYILKITNSMLATKVHIYKNSPTLLLFS